MPNGGADSQERAAHIDRHRPIPERGCHLFQVRALENSRRDDQPGQWPQRLNSCLDSAIRLPVFGNVALRGKRPPARLHNVRDHLVCRVPAAIVVDRDRRARPRRHARRLRADAPAAARHKNMPAR